MPTPTNLPLFPLNTVLFPGRELPLHIFEERYKLMVSRCLDSQSLFGVVLIRRGSEVGEPAEPYDVGTAARIVRVQRLEEGRINLLATGEYRFRVRAIVQQRPYLLGTVERLDDSSGPPVGPDLLQQVRSAANQYLKALTALRGGWLRDARLPSDTRALSYDVAAALWVESTVRQHLLEIPTVAQRLQEELQLIQREVERVRQEAAERLAYQGPRLN